MHTTIIVRYADRKPATPEESEETNRLRYLATLAKNLRRLLPDVKSLAASASNADPRPRC
ncbi:MAG: hypothetical protein CMO80_10940 [Verrucomicrobiales bacterium]|nr:hypothetical protein [Verrucomicrobiales bacterium]